MPTQTWFPLATFLPFEIKTKKKTQVMELRGRESLGQIDFIAYESDDTKSVTKNCDCNIFDVDYPTEVQCGWIFIHYTHWFRHGFKALLQIFEVDTRFLSKSRSSFL